MSDNVIRLATSQAKPQSHACLTCKFYHPDTNSFGWASMKTLWWGKSEPSASAFKYAVCSAFGGHTASSTRASEIHCNWGEAWEAKE